MQFNKTNKTVGDRAQITDVRMENDLWNTSSWSEIQEQV